MASIFDITGDTLRFKCDLVLAQMSLIAKALSSVDLSGLKRVDLSSVTKLDSAGIALLLEVRQKSTSLALIKSPVHLATLLELYNLSSQFDLVEA